MLNEIYDLFIDLDATEDQLDFPVIYTIARDGIAKTLARRRLHQPAAAVRRHRRSTFPAPTGDPDAILQFQVANLDYSDYLGRLAIGRVFNGTLRLGDEVAICKLDGSIQKTKITKLYSFEGLKRVEETDSAPGRHPGDRRRRRHHHRRDRYPSRHAQAAAQDPASTSRPSR